jgi:hypothetical protein
VARKAKKRLPRAKTPRDGENIRALLHAAGSREELDRWIDEERPPLKRGPRPITSDEEFEEFSAVFGDWFAMVPHRMRKKFIEQMWESDKKTSEDEALPPPVRKAWDPRRHIGRGTIESIVRRLERRLLKKATTPRAAKR